MSEKRNVNNREWLNSLDELDMLLLMSGLTYAYDNRFHNFNNESKADEEKWKEVMLPYIDFLEERLGEIAGRKLYKMWEESSSE